MMVSLCPLTFLPLAPDDMADGNDDGEGGELRNDEKVHALEDGITMIVVMVDKLALQEFEEPGELSVDDVLMFICGCSKSAVSQSRP
ncbi:hypothetical protein MN608_11776 [Microdochium nivale]|nr:hypothetical protein MN608_11776 [Microdochium nivale]